MARKVLIGLAGRARSGKDTVAGCIRYATGCETWAFARPLKDGVKVMFGLDDRHTDGELKEVVLPELGVSPRQLMQWLGTEYGRHLVGPDVWVDVAMARWRASKGSMVITDVRFENEAQAIRDNGGVIIHVQRDAAPQVAGHSSEAGVAVQECDYVIGNNGTLYELRVATLWLLDKIGPDLLEGTT